MEDNFSKEISELGSRLSQINKDAFLVYSPIVEELIHSGRKEAQEIDHLLDRLIDFACDENCLILFKKVCLYYWDIDKNATAWHINAYREMWDSEDEVE